jgi:hypothetical protein
MQAPGMRRPRRRLRLAPLVAASLALQQAVPRPAAVSHVHDGGTRTHVHAGGDHGRVVGESDHHHPHPQSDAHHGAEDVFGASHRAAAHVHWQAPFQRADAAAGLAPLASAPATAAPLGARERGPERSRPEPCSRGPPGKPIG